MASFRQRLAFDQLAGQLKALDRRDSTACQQLQLQQIAFELALHQQKLAVLGQYLALGDRAVWSDQGLAHTSLGKEWYAYLRKPCLTMDTTPDALMAMGNTELDNATTRYRTLQAHPATTTKAATP